MDPDGIVPAIIGTGAQPNTIGSGLGELDIVFKFCGGFTAAGAVWNDHRSASGRSAASGVPLPKAVEIAIVIFRFDDDHAVLLDDFAGWEEDRFAIWRDGVRSHSSVFNVADEDGVFGAERLLGGGQGDLRASRR